MFGESPLASILALAHAGDRGCGAIARDRADPGNERERPQRDQTTHEPAHLSGRDTFERAQLPAAVAGRRPELVVLPLLAHVARLLGALDEFTTN